MAEKTLDDSKGSEATAKQTAARKAEVDEAPADTFDGTVMSGYNNPLYGKPITDADEAVRMMRARRGVKD